MSKREGGLKDFLKKEDPNLEKIKKQLFEENPST